jgi:mRNA-degrading endonuclease toxin of MazEF toxin-antitoxin module
VNQGDIWLLESPRGGVRPALVITRQRAVDIFGRVTVALVTSTLRKGPTQLPLGSDEGMRTDCVANFDDLAVVDRAMLTRRLGQLGPRMHEMCAALEALADC